MGGKLFNTADLKKRSTMRIIFEDDHLDCNKLVSLISFRLYPKIAITT